MQPKHLVGAFLFASVAGLASLTMPQPAEADPPFGRGGPPGLDHRGGFPPGAQKFGYGGFCPPGLRDKGCVPPGLQKFGRGDIIPDFRSYDRLRYRDYGLPYPGDNRRYIRVGSDAYLIAEATQRVIEVINLLNR